MTKSRIIPSWQNAIIILSGTVVSLIIVIGLQWGRPVLIPIALAILLTFLLNPLVSMLQQRGFGRMPAVMLGVSASGAVILLIGALVARQVTILVDEFPQNTANIKAKVKTLRQMGSSPMAAKFEKMAEEITEETAPSSAEHDAAEHDAAEKNLKEQNPGERIPSELIVADQITKNGEKQNVVSVEKVVTSGPVIVQSTSTPWLGLTGYLSSAFEVLATLAFSLILLIVFLIGRDDLRDRVVVLAGRARVAVTSKALEDVTDRISRYLMMVALLNGGFGILFGIGLFVLQVPYAFLWGFLSGSLRFIPYVGPWIGAIGPLAISLATSDGWWQPSAVFGFVLVLELVSNNILEPLVFGRSTGVSSTALIISAAFWGYVWGPIGLVLSAPIAVCLMVIGKNIPQLSFLNLLLGSDPALRSDMGIYQRFLLGDDQEATRLLLLRLKDSPPEDVFDTMLIPTLNYAKRDFLRNQLSEVDHKLVLDGVQTLLRHTAAFFQTLAKRKANDAQSEAPEADASGIVAVKVVRLLVCPAADATDVVAVTMLRQSLGLVQWDFEQTAVETLTSELVARIASDPPAILFIASLPPRGLAHARYLCKRIHESSPQLPIIVGRWGRKRNGKIEREQLEDAGATFVTTSLAENDETFDVALTVTQPRRIRLDTNVCGRTALGCRACSRLIQPESAVRRRRLCIPPSSDGLKDHPFGIVYAGLG